MHEIEVKILEIPLSQTVEKIQEIGGKFVAEWFLVTVVYDFPDRRFLNDGAYIRLRQEGDKTRCTFKSPVSNQDYKIMNESEVEVSDFAVMENILLSLGLEKVTHFEKRRTRYQKDKILFEIDKLPNIPEFLEIEAPSQEDIQHVLQLLEIPQEQALSIGPKELLARYGIDLDQTKTIKF